MFVSRDRLRFDLAALIENSVSDWSTTQPMGFTRPVVESCGDYISDEMDACGLRRQDTDEATFDDQADSSAFREAVFAALDRWLVKVEISMKRTPEEMEDYRRPCGE
jgi:hypothetical protein